MKSGTRRKLRQISLKCTTQHMKIIYEQLCSDCLVKTKCIKPTKPKGKGYKATLFIIKPCFRFPFQMKKLRKTYWLTDYLESSTMRVFSADCKKEVKRRLQYVRY